MTNPRIEQLKAFLSRWTPQGGEEAQLEKARKELEKIEAEVGALWKERTMLQKNICAREQIIDDWKGKIPRDMDILPPKTKAHERAGNLPWIEIAKWDRKDRVVVVGDEYKRCTKGLEGFSHIWLIYILNNDVKAQVFEVDKMEDGRKIWVSSSKGTSYSKMYEKGVAIIDIKPYLSYCESITKPRFLL